MTYLYIIFRLSFKRLLTCGYKVFDVGRTWLSSMTTSWSVLPAAIAIPGALTLTSVTHLNPVTQTTQLNLCIAALVCGVTTLAPGCTIVLTQLGAHLVHRGIVEWVDEDSRELSTLCRRRYHLRSISSNEKRLSWTTDVRTSRVHIRVACCTRSFAELNVVGVTEPIATYVQWWLVWRYGVHRCHIRGKYLEEDIIVCSRGCSAVGQLWLERFADGN